MNGPLAQMFRYNRWANGLIIAACRALTDEQLDQHLQGAEERTIRETIFHIPAGQLDFLARINGQAQDWTRAREWQGFDALERAAAAGNAGLIAAAEALVDDADVVVPYMDKRPVFPKSLFLTHAFAHGVLHRTEICVMMRTLGIDPPNLDGWEYAAAAGMGQEAP
jgi:uncharacterized damage-inducible protein DinB